MIAQGIELPMAGASARRERKGHAQAPQQEHTELGAGDRDVRVGGRDIDGSGGEGSCLREQQRTRRGGKFRKLRLERALIAGSGCESLPAFERPWAGVFTRSLHIGCRRASALGIPTGGVVAGLAQSPLRRDCGGSRGESSFPLQGLKESFCGCRRSRPDNGQRVLPRGPVRGIAVCNCRAQAEPSKPLGEVGSAHACGWQGRLALFEQRS